MKVRQYTPTPVNLNVTTKFKVETIDEREDLRELETALSNVQRIISEMNNNGTRVKVKFKSDGAQAKEKGASINVTKKKHPTSWVNFNG